MQSFLCNHPKLPRFILALLAALVVFWLPAWPVYAQGPTCTVTDPGDSGANTLRQCVVDVDAGGTVDFNLSYPATITLASQIDIAKALTINGPGAENLAISGDNITRTFNITDTVAISGLTLRDGFTSSGAGGAILTTAPLTLTGVSVLNSQSNGSGGGVYAGSSLAINSSLFQGNRAAAPGGALQVDGAAVITGSRFISNTTPAPGGAIYKNGGTLTLTNADFSGNNNNSMGGAIYITGTVNPVLTNIVFSGNRGGSGGALYNDNSNLQLINVTFSGNSAPNPGGAIANSGTGNIQLVNGVIWGNSTGGVIPGAQIYNAGGTTALSYTLIQSGTGTTDILVGGGSVTTGPGVITSDPLFVAPITATVAPTTTGNYRLQAGSPAIDHGANSAIALTTDLDGNPRIQNGTVDMGAYEAPYTGPTAHDDPDESTPEDIAVTISPLLNDTDATSDTLTISAVGVPAHGQSSIVNLQSQIIYTPTLNYNGTDVFTYTASDGSQTDTATITVTVSAVNDAPRVVSGKWLSLGSSGFTPDEASYTSLALNRSGTPYVAFRDENYYGSASVMKYNGSSWAYVGSGGFSAGEVEYTSLALDSASTPYVAYQDGGNSFKASVMKFNGSSWVQVGSAGFSAGSAYYTSLALDSAGTPWVAYQDGGNSFKASVMKFNGSSWEQVGSAGFSAARAEYISLALDSAGTPYVAYTDWDNGSKASVMKFNGSSWEQVGSAGFSAAQAEYISLALDSSDMPWVAYRDNGSNNYASVMKFNGSSWEQVGSAGFTPYRANFISLALDSAGTPYVAFQDEDSYLEASVMKFNGSGWEYVGSSGFSADRAYFTSLAIDSNNTLLVVYQDADYYGEATLKQFNGAIAQTTASMSEDGSPTPFALTLAGRDIEGDPLSWSITSAAGHGTAAISQATITTATLAYTPTANYNGVDSFTVQVSDGALTATATVNVTVWPVNDAPVAADDESITEENVPVIISPLLNDTDPESDTLTITAMGSPAHGTAILSGTTQVVYTPTLNFLGTDAFTYTASDGALSATAAISVTVMHCTNAQTVTTTADSGVGSLRQAVLDVCPGGTVDFNLTYPAVITLTGQIDIAKPLTINGPGAANVAVSGNNITRTFQVDAVTGDAITITGLTLRDGNTTTDGGAILHNSGALTITNAVIAQSNADRDGGGIAMFDTLTILGSTIMSNTASGTDLGGGGLLVSGAMALISDTTISGNQSTTDDGGGVTTAHSVSDTITIINSLILGNSAADDGAGLKLDNTVAWIENTRFIDNGDAVDGGAMHIDYGSTVSLLNDKLWGNSASDEGGAIYVSGSVDTLVITSTDFISNTATSVGGAINNNGGSLTLTNADFSGNNSSAAQGGAIYNTGSANPVLTNIVFSGNRSIGPGGALYNDNSNLQLLNVTFSGNSSPSPGGAIYNGGAIGRTIQLVNGVIWGNSTSNVGVPGAQIYNVSGTTALSYTLIQSGTGIIDIYVDGGSVTFGPGVITSDPLFMAPITATAAPTTTGNYRLQAGSPAIDAGLTSAIAVTTDLDGNPRIKDGTVDMGAYEFAALIYYLPIIYKN